MKIKRVCYKLFKVGYYKEFNSIIHYAEVVL